MSVGEKSLADRVKVDKGFFTIFELKRRYDNTPKRVILDSNFQRDDVWSHVRQAELIESILMGLPLPIFYLNQDRYGRLVVVDGRQRLTAMFKYMNNEYALQKLKIMSELNGKHFDELEPVQRAQIEDFQLQAHIILPATPENIKYDIFDRVNRGGVQLNHQEIRNAMYGGKSTELLQKVAESECFRMATGRAFNHEKRMKDKYFVLRALGMYLYALGKVVSANGIYEYHGDIDELLGNVMESINKSDDVSSMYVSLEKALEDSYTLLGENAFRKTSSGQKSPLNMNLFETIIVSFMLYRNNDSEKLMYADQIAYELKKLINSDEFKKNISSNRDSTHKFLWRMQMCKDIARGIVK